MKRNERWILAALFAVGVMTCQSCHVPQPTPVRPTPAAVDASATCTGACTCANLCAHETDLGCQVANPTPAGHSCVEVCENNQSANIAPWDLDCRTHAANCNAVDFCQ